MAAETIEITTSRLTGKQVKKIIDDFSQAQYLINYSYYKGNNADIVATGIVNERKGKDPNNIIPLPFGRRTVNDLQGYAYKPGNVSYVFDDDQDGTAVELIEDIFKDNEEALESAEIFTDAAIKGEGAELTYFADEKIQFAKIPREQCIFEYEDTIKKDVLMWAIRFYKTIEIQPDGSDLITHKAEVYWEDIVEFYELKEDADLTKRNQQRQADRFDKNKLGKDYNFVEAQLHPFIKVPLYPYNINQDKLGVFQPSIPIIDKMDGLGSDSLANAIDQFNDTILTLSKKIDSKTAQKIKDSKIIDDLGGKDEGNFAEFLQRNLNIEGTIETTKIFERWYYELTGVPNLHDEKFGLKSGIAIAFALVPFENLVTTMEIYFTKGLQYRLDLINNGLIFLNDITDPVEATLEWKRNLPFDKKELVEIAVALKNSGLLSDETILKMFPDTIVADAEEEVAKKQKEADDRQAKFLATAGAQINEPEEPEE